MPAYVAAAVAVIGLLSSSAAQRQAASQAADAATNQRAAQDEQKANVASQQAGDRRAQVREERVRRARILQGSENTGTAGSSGEAGALGSISTQFSNNIGTSLGGSRVASSISNFQQTAADFSTQSSASMQNANMFNQLTSVSTNIFDRLAGQKPVPNIPTDSGSGDNSIFQEIRD